MSRPCAPATCRHCPLFFFNDPATTEISPLPLHDALPISVRRRIPDAAACSGWRKPMVSGSPPSCHRSEEHTSELQSRQYIVCRLLLEKKECSPLWTSWS